MTMQTDEMDKLLYEKIGACRDRWLESQPEQCEPHHFSEAFLADLPELAKRSRRSPWRILRIAAAVAALLAALTLTIGAELLPPVEFFRNGVVNILSQVLPKSTDQTYTSNYDHEGETKRPVLGWLPEGMVETECNENPISSLLNYKDNNNRELTIYIKRVTKTSANTSSFDTENAQVQEIPLHSSMATLSVKNGMVLIVFFIDNYRCSLSGTFTVDEAVKIAENIILK